MHIFPYELQRITGLPFLWLQKSWIPTEEISEFLRVLQLLEQQHHHCLELSNEILDQEQDYAFRKRLQQLRGDLLARRSIKLRKLERFTKDKQLSKLIKSLLMGLAELKDQKKMMLQIRERFDQIYQKGFVAAGNQLQEISKSEDFLKGLVLSSCSLYERCPTFWQVEPQLWNKKQQQTGISLLKYLTRMSTKTSPFSRFTWLAMRRISTGEALTAKSRFYLNTHLLPYLQEWLSLIPSFKLQLPIRLNPSLEKRGTEYRYILNSRNVESVQRLSEDELLSFIIEKVKGRSLVLHDVVRVLLNEISASKPEVESYLFELVEVGVLEWDWGISALDDNWDQKLLELIQGKVDFPGKHNFVDALHALKTYCDQLHQVSANERISILHQAYQQILSLAEETKDRKAHLLKSDTTFRRFKLTNLHLKPEQLFFEDCAGAPKDDIPTQLQVPIIEHLNRLVKAVCPVAVNQMQTVLLDYFQQEYPQGYRGGLLDVYESFYRFYLGKEHSFEEETKPSDELLNWEGAVRRLAVVTERGQVHLSLDGLEKVSEDFLPFIRMDGAWGGSTMLHTFQQGKQWKAYIDTVFTGQGKLFGRFLPLFPPAVSRDLQQWNRKMQGSRYWVENSDASYFNANVHPPLLDAEIASPGSHQRLHQDHQIPVGELVVNFKPPSKIELNWKGQKISIFDLGFESWRSRSPMYRLLNCFSPKFPDWTWFRDRLNAIFRGEGGRQDGHVRIPRITIGEDLVVQRQTWLFQAGQFPVPAKGETNTNYFLRVQKWQQLNNLPSRGFITIQNRSSGVQQGGAKNSSDDYKPQYMDLQHPLLVQLLGKLMKRKVQQLTFTEVLPSIPAEQSKGVINVGVEKIIEWGEAP